MPSPGLRFGESQSVQHLLRVAGLVALTSNPILILGEPGTGKTALARHLHTISGRPGAFVRCSMASLSEGIREDELQGHVRGSFTGAIGDRMGLVETAHRGTLFLDELGAASPAAQASLLHLLDDQVVRRLGESRDRPVDARFIAATNADVVDLAKSTRFRADLLGRFGYFRFTVPPLRERRDEIIPLFGVFLEEADPRRAGASNELEPAVQECLLAAPWPDNIRELRAVARYVAVVSSIHGQIGLEDLPLDFRAAQGAIHRHKDRRAAAREVLTRCNGNISRAAVEIGVSRTQLRRLLGS